MNKNINTNIGVSIPNSPQRYHHMYGSQQFVQITLLNINVDGTVMLNWIEINSAVVV
jgi:hypothetical protein